MENMDHNADERTDGLLREHFDALPQPQMPEALRVRIMAGAAARQRNDAPSKGDIWWMAAAVAVVALAALGIFVAGAGIVRSIDMPALEILKGIDLNVVDPGAIGRWFIPALIVMLMLVGERLLVRRYIRKHGS